ncbi:MAG: cation-translocating P-type ATPase [bacterium]
MKAGNIGLTAAEATRLLREHGPNELPSAGARGLLRTVFEVLREPMFLLLIAAGVVYLVLGEVQDALMLLGFVGVVIGITLYQERKTERALAALRDLSSPRALVIRDGVQVRIAGGEVVPGDLLVLAEGDRVPADAVLVDSSHLEVDESLLTGESAAVRKIPGPVDCPLAPPGGDDTSAVFSGTLVIQGQGLAVVRSTGAGTQLGRIGRALATLETEDSPLQKETRRMVRNLALAGLGLCILVVVSYVFTRGSLLGGLLAGLTLAMAILPEEIPVVLTVFLALGAWRMSRRHALTRRVNAIQALGSTTALCVDKTGTLTMNRMSVARLWGGESFCEVDPATVTALPESCHLAMEYAILAGSSVPTDPMERALRELGEQTLGSTEHLHADWSLVREYPLSRELLAMSRVWRSPDGQDYVIAAKGAPEAIGDLCHLDTAAQARLAELVKPMAEDALRVLGVARARFRKSELPPGQHEFSFELVGLVGFSDPIRPDVPAAIEACRAAGIRVVMITGDYPLTALNIARRIGLDGAGLLTGPELESLDDAALEERVRTVSVCARVVPEQKLRLVEALKRTGEVVVMTGDGVNDAPALKSAQVGIAMGGRGTDVAREAAAMVLLDDDFSTIVAAIGQGRRILDNLKKAIAYIFSVHVPIAGMSLLPVLFGWPLVLLPVHVVFLELIIDPACSVVFESEPAEPDLMRRRPRRPDEPLFDRRTVTWSILQGMVVLVVVLAVYCITYWRGRGELEARALTFTTLIVANLGLILSNRSWSGPLLLSLWRPNRALWWVCGGATVFLGLVLYVPFLRDLFKFGVLHADDLLLCLGAGIAGIVPFELYKLVRRLRPA